jgi:hypothetical protein
MGQRHQQFIRIINPLNNKRLNDKDKREWAPILGTEETTILPFHNQWLFGRSALGSALGLLEFSSGTTLKGKLSHDLYGNPLARVDYSPMSIESRISKIEFILNYIPKDTDWLNQGFNTSFFLKDEPIMRENFEMGDNNDGITIIDTLENKYCFMNINDYEIERTGINSLPYQIPVSAETYVKAYYGETEEALSNYYLENHTPEQIVKYLKDNIRINRGLYKRFKKFPVLTLEEIALMFPKMNLKNLEVSEK